MGGNENEEPGGRLRVGDQERESAIRRLGEHYQAGRLTADEHAERTDQALRAKTQADLGAVFADLPDDYRTTAQGAGQEGGQEGEGPWGWGLGAPWTAPQDRPGRGGGRRPAGTAWAAGGREPGLLSVPLVAALVALAVVFSIGCSVVAGHPPVLPLVAVLTGVFVVLRRRKERRA